MISAGMLFAGTCMLVGLVIAVACELCKPIQPDELERDVDQRFHQKLFPAHACPKCADEMVRLPDETQVCVWCEIFLPSHWAPGKKKQLPWA